MAEKVEPPPTPTARDPLVEIASSAAGEFPLAGTVVEVLRQIFGTAYEHRREAWVRRLDDLVVELDERGVDVDALVGQPAFVTAVHDASRIAMGEHIEEKLDMLKAVLFNAATRVPDEVSDLWTLRYLSWVDELEPQHIAVLRIGLDPRSWLTEAGVDMPEFMSSPAKRGAQARQLSVPSGADGADPGGPSSIPPRRRRKWNGHWPVDVRPVGHRSGSSVPRVADGGLSRRRTIRHAPPGRCASCLQRADKSRHQRDTADDTG